MLRPLVSTHRLVGHASIARERLQYSTLVQRSAFYCARDYGSEWSLQSNAPGCPPAAITLKPPATRPAGRQHMSLAYKSVSRPGTTTYNTQEALPLLELDHVEE